MREVIPSLLWIGHAYDARNIRQVLDAGIRAVIDLAIQEHPIPFPREIPYCRFPLHDGAGNEQAVLRAAISTARILVEAQVPTLVFCGAGMSRSPAIIAAVISLVQECDLDAALLEACANGPHDVSPALRNDVKRVVKKYLTPKRE